MSIVDWKNYNTTESDIKEFLKSDVVTFESSKTNSFGSDIQSTESWLLSIATSYLLSVVITGPIGALVSQFIRVVKYKHGNDINDEYFFTLYPHFV